MFGYVLPCVNEMGTHELELYKAVYCGVCKAIGTRVGQLSRYTLSYDIVFLALSLMLLDPNGYSAAASENCVAHPFKKRAVIRRSDAIDFIADINVLTAYFKLLDDRDDENSCIGRTLAGALKPAVKRIRERRETEYGVIEEGIRRLKELEKKNCDVIDMAADPFSDMMAKLLRYDPRKA